MGIPQFNKWLRTEYHDAYLNIKGNTKYDYIYIDTNHILHNCIKSKMTEDEFVSKLYNSLNTVFNNFMATKKIIIAIDGPAPYAKLILQRLRRVKYVENINCDSINSIYLTPGTNFIKKVENYIKKYIANIKKNCNYLNFDVVTVFSDEPGEGEIKLFQKLREYGLKNKDASHLVIGNDADLVVIAVAQHPIKNINLLVRNKDQFELISVNKLINLFDARFIKWKNTKTNSKGSLRGDFVLLSLMMGNDYFPKLLFSSFESLWSNYKKVYCMEDGFMIEDGQFNKKFLMRFITSIIDNKRAKYKKYININFSNTNTENYLEGLLWCFQMYTTGICPKYDYVFNNEYTPNPGDILNYLICYSKNTIKVPKSDSKPLPSEDYCLFTMPLQAKKLIPKKYHNLMDKELKFIYEDENCDLCDAYKIKITKLKKEKNKEELKKITNKLSNHRENKHLNKGNGFSINEIRRIEKLLN